MSDERPAGNPLATSTEGVDDETRRAEARRIADDLDDGEREIADRLGELIVELKPETAGRVEHAARLQSDVGLDSVAIIDLVIAAEDEFGIEIPDDDTGDLMDASVAELARRVRQLGDS